MSNKVKSKAKFLDEMLENLDFKDWIQRHKKDPNVRFVNIVLKPFQLQVQE